MNCERLLGWHSSESKFQLPIYIFFIDQNSHLPKLCHMMIHITFLNSSVESCYAGTPGTHSCKCPFNILFNISRCRGLWVYRNVLWNRHSVYRLSKSPVIAGSRLPQSTFVKVITGFCVNELSIMFNRVLSVLDLSSFRLL